MLVALAVTVAAGLLSRAIALPGILREQTGDALYATATWWLLALLWPGARASTLAAAAFAFASAVEASQQLHFGWLDALRATTPGRLLLGQGFQWADVVAYAVGTAIAVGADRLIMACRRRPPSRDGSPPRAP